MLADHLLRASAGQALVREVVALVRVRIASSGRAARARGVDLMLAHQLPRAGGQALARGGGAREHRQRRPRCRPTSCARRRRPGAGLGSGGAGAHAPPRTSTANTKRAPDHTLADGRRHLAAQARPELIQLRHPLPVSEAKRLGAG